MGYLPEQSKELYENVANRISLKHSLTNDRPIEIAICLMRTRIGQGPHQTTLCNIPTASEKPMRVK